MNFQIPRLEFHPTPLRNRNPLQLQTSKQIVWKGSLDRRVLPRPLYHRLQSARRSFANVRTTADSMRPGTQYCLAFHWRRSGVLARTLRKCNTKAGESRIPRDSKVSASIGDSKKAYRFRDEELNQAGQRNHNSLPCGVVCHCSRSHHRCCNLRRTGVLASRFKRSEPRARDSRCVVSRYGECQEPKTHQDQHAVR